LDSRNRLRRCVICSAAPVNNADRLRKLIRNDDYIIAADGGLKLANRLGVKTDYLVADFDSLENDNLDYGVPVYRLPKRKDDTDTMAAARIGLEHGFKDFLLLGASGGRLDHTFANFSVLLHLIQNGAKAVLADEQCIVEMLLPGTTYIKPVENAYLSLLPFGGSVTGLTVKKAGYELRDAVLSPDYPIGISNEFIGETVEIAFKAGILIIFISKD
jgi:thiamine pyrophosphokinase